MRDRYKADFERAGGIATVDSRVEAVKKVAKPKKVKKQTEVKVEEKEWDGSGEGVGDGGGENCREENKEVKSQRCCWKLDSHQAGGR